MEVPDLLSSAIGCLDVHVSVIINFKVSVVWQLGNNMEISLDVKSELLIELSLSWFSLPLISVDDVPLLVDLVSLGINSDVPVFLVNIALDLQNFTLLIDNRSTLVSEHLPPS